MGLELKNVVKKYEGKTAVDEISFKLDKPCIFGLLGTNGAGKTTTIRMLLGTLKKDSGDILWNGKEVKRETVNFGYLPEERGIYQKTKVYEQIMYFAELQGMSKNEADKEIRKWAKELKVEEYLDMKAEKLSKGNQQKVQLVAALVHNPDLIVLDEPFSGLDPVNAEILKNIVLDLLEKGKYIIMSSHQMSSIEEFCTDVLILNKGKTVLKGNLSEIKNSYKSNKLEVTVNQNIEKYISELNLEIEKTLDYSYYIKLENEEIAHKLLKNLISNNIEVLKFEMKKPTLNDIFIEKVGGTDA